MKSPETGNAVIRKFIVINELLLPVSCLTSPDVSRLRYLPDPGMRSDEAEAAAGTTRKARAPIARACVGQEAESRHRGVGAAGRSPDRSGGVHACSFSRYLFET